MFHYSENLTMAAQNLRLGRGLDTAGLKLIPRMHKNAYFLV